MFPKTATHLMAGAVARIDAGVAGAVARIDAGVVGRVIEGIVAGSVAGSTRGEWPPAACSEHTPRRAALHP